MHQDVVIIGASGFIGRHLVKKCDQPLRLLSHKSAITASERVTLVQGDLFDVESLQKLITSGSTVVNLVYLSQGTLEDNLRAIANLVQVCRAQGAKRIVHCSTAVICGRAMEDVITEETMDQPFDSYEKVKCAIEKALLDQTKEQALELAILRPTCVFGPHGKNLVMLFNDLSSGANYRNYLKSCLYNNRTMNLVSVNNVVSALAFLIEYNRPLHGERFIISDDENLENNFRYVEKAILEIIKKPDYQFPRATCPESILSLIVRAAKKSNINPRRRFMTAKLEKMGWKREFSFPDELRQFLEWYNREKKN
ncbi:MAG: hypothetical protein A2X86_18530 [Bdellovibrionales bacterium GWA2_49_15]|nr:MAG: hypothetical protein A2X86_18530 [Bdellovibrionales bacterium GWA2_49_15]